MAMRKLFIRRPRRGPARRRAARDCGQQRRPALTSHRTASDRPFGRALPDKASRAQAPPSFLRAIITQLRDKFGPGICRACGGRTAAVGRAPRADCRPAAGAIVAGDVRKSPKIVCRLGRRRDGRCAEAHAFRRARSGCRLPPTWTDLNPEQRAAVEARRRTRAGAGGRRHRQDARAHHAHRPHPVHGPRARLADPGRHLHQQGRARDEGAHRRAGGRRRRGHAVARHVPLHRRQDPAPPRRAGGPQVRLHDPRHRRPDPADQAGDRERRAGQGPLAGAAAGGPDRQLEEPRPDARQGAARGGLRLRRGQGRRALCAPTRSASRS